MNEKMDPPIGSRGISLVFCGRGSTDGHIIGINGEKNRQAVRVMMAVKPLL